ncbi:MAG: uroporphyrinogen-III synthase [Rhodospirillales bacterium]|nr:uroporphyrinogen-III synthase [Rhodospirillales bacterium]MDE0381368.1 uroporphyrinogen-III synthase [Rhodospirillales bacterium]
MSGARLLLTRPREDSVALADALARHGVAALIEPMMTIRIDEAARLDLSGVQAILLTSANGARALAAATPESAARRVPVLAVGCATARAAIDAGFDAVTAADGDVDALAALAGARLHPDAGRLVHVAGRVSTGDLAARLRAAGFRAERVALYDAVAASAFTPPARQALEAQTLAGVALFSPRTARLFAKLMHESGLETTARALTAFCLSQAVAVAVETLSWKRVCVAAAPRQQALVACVVDAFAPGPE